MPNPIDAPDAVAAAAEPLEELLDDCNHVSTIELLPAVPVAGTAPGPGWINRLAQAVYDAGPTGHQVGVAVHPFESPHAWRDVFHREVTSGYMQPASKWPSAPDLPTPDEIRRTGELADGIADLIEAHLGPVRACADVYGPPGYVWWRDLLLVTDAWVTILHLEIYD